MQESEIELIITPTPEIPSIKWVPTQVADTYLTTSHDAAHCWQPPIMCHSREAYLFIGAAYFIALIGGVIATNPRRSK